MKKNFYETVLSYTKRHDLVARLEEEIPTSTFTALGVPPYAIPKVYRGIPKKRAFRDWATLKRHYTDRAILSLYLPLELSLEKIGLFTWVMADGYGDFAMQELLAKEIGRLFPATELYLVTRLSKNQVPPASPLVHEPLTPDAVHKMACCDLVIQSPTYFRGWGRIEKQLLGKAQVEHLGEYGFIDSPRFHPGSKGRCLGLHFLEKGVLIPSSLDGRGLPVVKNRYLAYLTSKRGFVIFLAMLCVKAEGDIEVIVPKLDPFFVYMDILKGFAAAHGVGRFELYFDGTMCPIAVAPEGNVIKIFCRPQIGREEFLTLMKTSPIVACRGNQSLMEALALGKPLFYDPVKHNLPFLYDLQLLVKDRLPELLPLFSVFSEAFEGDVEEWLLIGKRLVSLVAPTFSLFELLKREYCFNPVLEAIIKRAAYIRRYPNHAEWEEEARERLPFAAFYGELKRKLYG